MMTLDDRIKDIKWRLVTSTDRLRHYRARFDTRSCEIQEGVIDRQLGELFTLLKQRDAAEAI